MCTGLLASCASHNAPTIPAPALNFSSSARVAAMRAGAAPNPTDTFRGSLARASRHARIKLVPAFLTVHGVGAVNSVGVSVSERGYKGTLTQSATASNCEGIADTSPTSGKGPKFLVRVSGISAGSCEIMFVDKRQHQASLFVSVIAPPIVGTGDLYVADTGNNAVKKIDPAGVISTIGSGFSSPEDVALDSAGNIYVADSGNNAVKKVVPGGAISTVGSGFSSPTAVAVDPIGNVYVADTNNNAIKKVSPGGTITCVPSTLSVANCGTAGFSFPAGVAVDSAGDVFVADQRHNAVKKVAPNGTVTCVPSTLSLARCNSSEINYPAAVAVDSAGNVYVANYGNGNVLSVAPNGTVSCIPSYLSVYDGCGITDFYAPIGVAVDSTGNVYVVNSTASSSSGGSNNVTNIVKEVNPISGATTNIGTGFNLPHGVAVDAVGDPFVHHRRNP